MKDLLNKLYPGAIVLDLNKPEDKAYFDKIMGKKPADFAGGADTDPGECNCLGCTLARQDKEFGSINLANSERVKRAAMNLGDLLGKVLPKDDADFLRKAFGVDAPDSQSDQLKVDVAEPDAEPLLTDDDYEILSGINQGKVLKSTHVGHEGKVYYYEGWKAIAVYARGRHLIANGSRYPGAVVYEVVDKEAPAAPELKYIEVNGIKVPAPLTMEEYVALDKSESLFLADPTVKAWYVSIGYNDPVMVSPRVAELVNRGLVHFSSSAAIKHAKALIGQS